jgi:hypothetical protein
MIKKGVVWEEKHYDYKKTETIYKNVENPCPSD